VRIGCGTKQILFLIQVNRIRLRYHGSRKSVSKNIKTMSTKDFEDVVATVAKYVEGLRVGWPRPSIMTP